MRQYFCNPKNKLMDKLKKCYEIDSLEPNERDENSFANNSLEDEYNEMMQQQI
jgi:hypothetical protein